MEQERDLHLGLTPEEEEMISILREEMGLDSDEAVVRLLLKQAVQRVAITCPTCGHYARRTGEEEAQCTSCLSVIRLAEDLWEARD